MDYQPVLVMGVGLVLGSVIRVSLLTSTRSVHVSLRLLIAQHIYPAQAVRRRVILHSQT